MAHDTIHGAILKAGSYVEVITSLRPKVMDSATNKPRHAKSRRRKVKAGIFRGIILAETGIPDSRVDGEESNYLVMSLAKRSWPFKAGQIVWIKSDQITTLNSLS